MTGPASERSARDSLRVGGLMSPVPTGVDQFDTVVDAARRMRAAGISAVPVTDERSRFLGMLSDRDIIEKSVADGQNPNVVTAGSLIRTGQASIDPDRIADRALLAMIVAEPQAELPVVQHGRLVGILGIADLAMPLIDKLDDASLDLTDLWPDDSRR